MLVGTWCRRRGDLQEAARALVTGVPSARKLTVAMILVPSTEQEFALRGQKNSCSRGEVREINNAMFQKTPRP